MFVFVHAQGIKTVQARGGGMAKILSTPLIFYFLQNQKWIRFPLCKYYLFPHVQKSVNSDLIFFEFSLDSYDYIAQFGTKFLRPEVRGDFNIHRTKFF